ncbi:hypothetical protein CgunFtcFv8_017107 [Champsocephalus gunnari]|uniref:Uncharacterized protein n=1 Tax=Champsocephalus gunnari TaxID=52237 RepID=A0AAN8CRU3_CHAGU|nr:hypothetical protein CgunFtcFv8_017107 [Champsocephalus gunnari]
MDKQVSKKGLLYPEKPDSGIFPRGFCVERKADLWSYRFLSERSSLSASPARQPCSQQSNNQQVNAAKLNTAQNNPEVYTT